MRARVSVLALVLVSSGCAGDVECTRLYPNGGLRARGRTERTTGLETGEWSTWYANGQLRERGRYESGRRVGVWEQWHPSGARRSAGMRVHDPRSSASPRSGAWTLWHSNGVCAARGIYERGAREGAWEYSLADGSLDGDRTGQYHADVKLDP